MTVAQHIAQLPGYIALQASDDFQLGVSSSREKCASLECPPVAESATV